MKIVNDGYELVEIDSISPHPDNPNRGDLEVIEESMDANGFFGAVYVQKSSRHILAGNHTHQAAKNKGLTEIPVIWVDVNDQDAKRILLVDNRSAEYGQRDDAMVARILQELGNSDLGTAGTGYSQDAVDELLKTLTPPDYNPLPPAGFKEVDSDLQTDHRCPKCGYEWSGKQQ